MLSGRPPLAARVRHFIQQNRLLPPGASLVVAVSGGPDSVCLLYLLHQLSREYGWRLHVAHLDHRLRGAASTADARYVARLAKRLGLPATLGRAEVGLLHTPGRGSLEEVARQARYAFLARVCRQTGAGRVAVGHTADDQAETLLLHLIRGAGTTGLRGLLPLSRWQTESGEVVVIRPLLEIRRAEALAYCRQHRLRPRQDASNRSLLPLRNRLRQQLLPLLEEYNPRVVDALQRTAAIVRQDVALLEEVTGLAWEQVARREGDTIVLERAGLLALSPYLRSNLLRRALVEAWGNSVDLEERHVRAMEAALSLRAGRSINLPRRLRFVVSYDRYLLGHDAEAACPWPEMAGEVTLHVPGETRLPGWRVTAQVLPVEAAPPAADGFTANLDAARATPPLVVRTRRHGDRFQPLGMGNLKRLSRFMIDEQVPRHWRDRVPLVVSGENIIWVVGHRLDHRARVTPGTKCALHLRFQRLP